MTEVVGIDDKDKRYQVSKLEDIYRGKEAEVRAERTKLKQLAEQLGTAETDSRFCPPISAKVRLSAAPIRSTPPRASCRSSVISINRYLKLVDPRLATRIFMECRFRIHPW